MGVLWGSVAPGSHTRQESLELGTVTAGRQEFCGENSEAVDAVAARSQFRLMTPWPLAGIGWEPIWNQYLENKTCLPQLSSQGSA